MSSATTGWQNTQQIESADAGSVAWQTGYNWTGGQYSVKSYANLDLKSGIPNQLSDISSIPSAWDWQYPSASSDLVADVSYDLWLSTDRNSQGATASTSYEIMVWLSTRGHATPAGKVIATASVNSMDWTLYQGAVKTWTVFSFVASTEIMNFNADLKPFLNYLTSNQSVPSSHYLVQAQAGTEPFIGSATFLTNAYSLAVSQ
ncbi:concanavalin A-like lectin/glucanase domain-containing protein [Cyathus striatus]|nr:concanavalin A-like lectin/glucanase domain-containing protein [Cyathus striatus]